MKTIIRPSGIEGLGDMSWGTHFCLFYETKDDLLDVLIPYFKAGLESDEFCLYVASEPVVAEEAERALRGAIPNFERYLAEGLIEIVSHSDWYLSGGHFDPLRVRQAWMDKLNGGLAQGNAGMRFAANTFWLEKEDWDSFAEYERKVDEAFRKLRIVALCAYALERCSTADMLNVVRHHQFTVVKRNGIWEHLGGSELKRAHDEIRQLNADLEHRVVERTAQLATTNEQLKEEIIERKQAEALLFAREQEFRAFVENAPDQIIRYDKEFRRTYVNPAVLSAYGLPKEAFIGKPVGSVVEDAGLEPDIDAVSTIRRQIKSVINTGEPTEYEVTFPSPGGRRTYWTRMYPEFDPNGVVINVLSISREITDHKRAEEAIRKSEQVLREAESLGHTGSWEQNLVTGEIFNTEENLRLFFGDDHSKGADFEDYAEAVHPDDREYVRQRRVQLLTERGPSDIEYRVVWPDGSVHVIFGRATVVYDESGGAVRVYGTNVDITERKRAEEVLRQSESNFRTLAEKSLEGIQLYQGGRSVYANAAMTALMGYSQEEFKAMSMEEHIALVHPLDRAVAVERARKRQAGQEVPASLEVRVLTKAGATRWVQGFTNEIEYNGQPAILSTAIDITERKRAEEDTKRQAARAETLARIAARLNKQLDLEAVIHAVCDEAINTFQVSQATMSLYDEKSDLLIYAGGINIPPEYAASMEPITRSQFDDFLQALGPIMVVPDIQALPDVPNAKFSSRLDVHTVVTTAMLRDQELIGVLVVGVNGHVREFDQDELTLLKAMSDQAAQAIANALLLKSANEQHEQLRALSTRVVEVQETERRALTTELHDRVGQNLTGLSINLQNMKALLSEGTVQALATKFDDAQALLEETTRHIRDIMAELYLPELEDYGLAAALETYAERAASRGNLELIADLPDLSPPLLPVNIRIALFRAVQEAISNVLKHANATRLEIHLQEEGGLVRLRVEDNGQGFDPNAASQKESPSWGLKIMRERIESIGGKLHIESRPGAGTRAIFEIERPH